MKKPNHGVLEVPPFGGRMIDYAMYRMGEDMLAKAETISGKAASRHQQTF